MIDFGIRFKQVEKFILHGYSESDRVGSDNDIKRTIRYCFNFDSGVFSWCSKKQEVIAQSIIKTNM